ncbi:cysteine hydrolase family protein [Streptomyces geranii]|uniref:cysteine hydrolase family protein n=1 Tax=Streptomyces geranii TaxID=2058923 RepID=UPI000D033527|nr:isochorismatase family cysteine hydrolase [Streptomyces geranii]
MPGTDLRARQLAHLSRPGSAPALLVVDVQRDFADPDRLTDYGLTDSALTALDRAVTRIGHLVDAARAAQVPVIWVELGSDPARPWRASNWLRGGDYDAPMSPDEPCRVGTDGAEWFRMRPAEGEERVVKRGYSGFLGTDLDARLRAAGCGWLTVVGLTSECCVYATAQDAVQLDWPVVVPGDATAAYDLDVNAAALQQLALNVAVLADADEVTALWERNSR